MPLIGVVVVEASVVVVGIVVDAVMLVEAVETEVMVVGTVPVAVVVVIVVVVVDEVAMVVVVSLGACTIASAIPAIEWEVDTDQPTVMPLTVDDTIS